MPTPTRNTPFVNVECVSYFDHSDIRATIALPAQVVSTLLNLPFNTLHLDSLGYYTTDSPSFMLHVPGSFVVR